MLDPLLLDELARCYMRAAVERAISEVRNENAIVGAAKQSDDGVEDELGQSITDAAGQRSRNA